MYYPLTSGVTCAVKYSDLTILVCEDLLELHCMKNAKTEVPFSHNRGCEKLKKLLF